MESDLFGSEGGGGSTSFQHLIWFLGHPEVWLTFLLWAALLIAIVKIGKRLWRLQQIRWFVLFVTIVGAALVYYIWLSVQAHALYVEGRVAELEMLPYAKRVFLVLSCLSAGWIIFDWFKARRSR